MSRHHVDVHQLSVSFGSSRPSPYLNVVASDYHWLGVHGHIENGIHMLGRNRFGSLIFICLVDQAQMELVLERWPPSEWTWMEIEGIKS